MLPPFALLRQQLADIIHSLESQGHEVEGVREELRTLPDSYDAMHNFALRLQKLPLKQDWPWVEPDDLPDIEKECSDDRPAGAVGEPPRGEARARAKAAFLGSVCGCMLGKPIEIQPTMKEIRNAARQCGEWPLNDYIPEALLTALGRRHLSWKETVRERIRYVAPDDDINYSILGMLLLEQHGITFTRDHIRKAWLHHLHITSAWGPERTTLLKAGIGTLLHGGGSFDDCPVQTWNPGDELCGALIRADAYGYACPGRPALAAALAWRDSSFTHRRTGVYAAMWVAAAIALAPVIRNRLDIFRIALTCIPRRSRFHFIINDSINKVAEASNWQDGYSRIHGAYGQYGHCRVYQECGTLVNTLHFARNVGDGICMQVMQGNDTDSFGATAGSLLGAYFGPGHLEGRWLRPLGDELRTSLANFFERSLTAVAERMGRLPAMVMDSLKH